MIKNERFRVKPGLSITSKELARRIRLNQQIPQSEGIFNTEEMPDIRTMSKIDIERAKIENRFKINSLRKQLENEAGRG